MTILKDINELNLSMKFILLAICLTSPFFYIDIYFLKNTIFIASPVYIPIVTAFCMGICWYSIGTLCTSLVMKYYINKKPLFNQENFQTMVIIISLIWVSLTSFICIYFQSTFRQFFYVLIVVIIFRFILAYGMSKAMK